MTPFDITATPTLEAVATADEHALATDLQKRVEEALAEAHERGEVSQAAEAHRAAEAAVENLQTAVRVLNESSREWREQIAAAVAKTLDKLIESAGQGGKPDYASASHLAGLEHRERLTGRALERVVEHLTPLARIALLRAESHALMARAKALEEAANRRAEKVLEQMRHAVSGEVVLPVDLSKGVAGALVNHAAQLRRLAMVASTNADQMEKSYMDRNRKDGRV